MLGNRIFCCRGLHHICDRAAALRLLGCEASEERREVIRDHFYRAAIKVHPDTRLHATTDEHFHDLAMAYHFLVTSVPFDNSIDKTKFDAFSVYLGAVEEGEKERLRHEISQATELSSGGLDRGGMWMMATMLAEDTSGYSASSDHQNSEEKYAPKLLKSRRKRRRGP